MLDQPRMTPADFKEAQHQLGLSDRQFAAVLGLADEQNVRRYKIEDRQASSFREVPPWIARLVRAYLDGYRPKDWPIKR